MQQHLIYHKVYFHLQIQDRAQDNPKAQKLSEYCLAAPSWSLLYELVLSQLEISLISNMPADGTHGKGANSIMGENVYMKVHLKVKVIDGGKGTQTIVADSKEGVCSFFSKEKCKQKAIMVNPLRQTIQDTGYKKHVTILNRTHLRQVSSF